MQPVVSTKLTHMTGEIGEHLVFSEWGNEHLTFLFRIDYDKLVLSEWCGTDQTSSVDLVRGFWIGEGDEALITEEELPLGPGRGNPRQSSTNKLGHRSP